MTLDKRQHAHRPDLADARLRGVVEAAQYVDGQSARIKVGRSRALAQPNATAPIETHYHYGEKVLVFETKNGFCWCQSLRDGHVAYAPAADVALSSSPAATHYVVNMGCYAYPEPDLRSQPCDFLPRRSAVSVVEARNQTRGTTYLETVDGLHVPERCLGTEPNNGHDVIGNALRYIGTPYLWGGRSFLGLDCSALVQNAFEDAGVTVPRDSDLQCAQVGDDVSVADVSALKRYDLIFIPGHVVMYDGEGSVIHADGGSMMVIKQLLSEFVARRGIEVQSLRVRRHRF